MVHEMKPHGDAVRDVCFSDNGKRELPRVCACVFDTMNGTGRTWCDIWAVKWFVTKLVCIHDSSLHCLCRHVNQGIQDKRLEYGMVH